MDRITKHGGAGLVMIALGRLSATGRLPRNVFAGIRIPSTMRSDDAWRAGHRAAASALTASGVGPLVVAAIIAAKRPDRDSEAALLRIGRAWLVCWLGLATFQARRAARETVGA